MDGLSVSGTRHEPDSPSWLYFGWLATPRNGAANTWSSPISQIETIEGHVGVVTRVALGKVLDKVEKRAVQASGAAEEY